MVVYTLIHTLRYILVGILPYTHPEVHPGIYALLSPVGRCTPPVCLPITRFTVGLEGSLSHGCYSLFFIPRRGPPMRILGLFYTQKRASHEGFRPVFLCLPGV